MMQGMPASAQARLTATYSPRWPSYSRVSAATASRQSGDSARAPGASVFASSASNGNLFSRSSRSRGATPSSERARADERPLPLSSAGRSAVSLESDGACILVDLRRLFDLGQETGGHLAPGVALHQAAGAPGGGLFRAAERLKDALIAGGELEARPLFEHQGQAAEGRADDRQVAGHRLQHRERHVYRRAGLERREEIAVRGLIELLHLGDEVVDDCDASGLQLAAQGGVPAGAAAGDQYRPRNVADPPEQGDVAAGLQVAHVQHQELVRRQAVLAAEGRLLARAHGAERVDVHAGGEGAGAAAAGAELLV